MKSNRLGYFKKPKQEPVKAFDLGTKDKNENSSYGYPKQSNYFTKPA